MHPARDVFDGRKHRICFVCQIRQKHSKYQYLLRCGGATSSMPPGSVPSSLVLYVKIYRNHQNPPNKAVNIWNTLCSFFSVLYGFDLIAAAFQGPSLFNDVVIIHLFATSRRGSFRSPFRLVFLSVSCSSPGEGGGDEAAVESPIVLSM